MAGWTQGDLLCLTVRGRKASVVVAPIEEVFSCRASCGFVTLFISFAHQTSCVSDNGCVMIEQVGEHDSLIRCAVPCPRHGLLRACPQIGIAALGSKR